MRGLLIGEEGFDKFYSIKGLEVGHFFAQTNVFHRDFHLMRNTDDHTTFGGAVQFCDGQSGHFGRFDKLFGLFKSILSGQVQATLGPGCSHLSFASPSLFW